MTAISVPSLRPLEDRKAAVLGKAVSAARDRALQPMLVGAFARDIWFWHLYGVETERTTEDVDISMAFPNWEEFRRFTEVLLGLGLKQAIPNHPEKFIDPETKQKLDLLPFGQISEDGRSIRWPADNSLFTILGFEESYQSSVILSLAPDSSREIRVVTLPGMILLKIISFYERLQDRKRKDGADITFTLNHYLDAGNKVRLEQHPDVNIMDEVEGDLQRASAMLLGRDIGRLAGSACRSEVLARLKQEIESPSRCPLARELRQGIQGGDFNRARELLRDLLNGMEAIAHA